MRGKILPRLPPRPPSLPESAYIGMQSLPLLFSRAQSIKGHIKYHPFPFYYFHLSQPFPSIVAYTYLTAASFSLSRREYLTLARLEKQMVGPYVCPALFTANEVMFQ